MIVAIDSGNTSSKVGVFEHGTLVNTYEKRAYSDLIRMVTGLNPSKILISTVKIPEERFRQDLPSGNLFIYNHLTPMPIRIRYATPATLGSDRIALAAGAWNEFPGKNILVISAGTCITYDLVNRDGEYLGGGISPGLRMRLRSLHHFTANLPAVEPEKCSRLFGDSTESSILSGTVQGIHLEMAGFIDLYQANFPDIRVIFSGGDVNFFESKLKGRIFAIPNLVLKGIYTIYSYHEKPT